jgi:acyl carrier protein
MPTVTDRRVRAWLVERIAQMLKVSPDTVSSHAVFSELGLSSIQAVELTGELEQLTGLAIPATLVFEYPTIDDAATYVVSLDKA